MNSTDRFFLLDYETTGVGYDDVPIEVGVIVTDSTLTEIATYETLISSGPARDFAPEFWAEAEQFHGIPQSAILEPPAKGALTVARDLVRFAAEHRPNGGRLILASDNIQFEWRHTDWLLSHVGLTCLDVFHYCGWDTSILSLFTDFEDPTGTEHRALSDARGLLDELRRVRAGQSS